MLLCCFPCQVFSIISSYCFIEGLGGLEQAQEAIDYFRNETKKAGFPGLHVQTIVYGTPQKHGDLLQRIEALGADSVTNYNWERPRPEDYIKWGVGAMERREKWDQALSIPIFPNASIGWDDLDDSLPEQAKQ